MIKTEKTQLEISDFFGQDFTDGNFALAQKILRIRDRVEAIRWVANKRLDDDGEFAKLHCSSINEWMDEILTVANVTLQAHLDANSKEK